MLGKIAVSGGTVAKTQEFYSLSRHGALPSSALPDATDSTERRLDTRHRTGIILSG